MPGSFGTTDVETGESAYTTSKANVGVYGYNEGLIGQPAGVGSGSGVFGVTKVDQAAGVFGANTGTFGYGVQGNGPLAGVYGNSEKTGVLGETRGYGATGVQGGNYGTSGVGVAGNGPDAGVYGFSVSGAGVIGFGETGAGVRADSNFGGNAVEAVAHNANGVGLLTLNTDTNPPSDPEQNYLRGHGILSVTTVPRAAGILAANNHSTLGVGVQGNGPEVGVSGYSENGYGVTGATRGDGPAGVLGYSENGAGVLAQSKNIGIHAQGGNFAGLFEGTVKINGKLEDPSGSDIFGIIAELQTILTSPRIEAEWKPGGGGYIEVRGYGWPPNVEACVTVWEGGYGGLKVGGVCGKTDEDGNWNGWSYEFGCKHYVVGGDKVLNPYNILRDVNLVYIQC